MSAKKKARRIVVFMLACMLAFSLSPCSAFDVAAGGVITGTRALPRAVIEDGVYSIQNCSDNKYINSFDMKYDKFGRAYTASGTNEEGQYILILRQSDGSYVMYPQSEFGEYAFCTSQGTGAGSIIGKSKTVDRSSMFDIFAQSDGTFTIGVRNTNDDVVFSVLGDVLFYRNSVVTLENYVGGVNQKWKIAPVGVNGFELKTVSENISLYSVGKVYAVISPSYLKQFVKWQSSDEKTVYIDSDGSFCALAEGQATVTASYGEFTDSITINVTSKAAHTWYSQNNSETGGWHGGELSDVYFSSGAYKRFVINGHNRGLDWMDQGCAIASTAMVLHNLGATLDSGYDFRFEAENNLEADPYTVALANSYNYGLLTSSGTLYHNPILLCNSAIAARFTLYGKPITWNSVSGRITKKQIKDALEEHPEGVIIAMRNGSQSHYIVVTECVNPDAENSNDFKFLIYDSASQTRDDSVNVLFEDSISYTDMYYRYSSFVEMITWGLA